MDISNEVTQIIDTIANKLGVAASIIVPEYAKVEIARAAVLILLGLIFIIGGCVCIHFCIKHYKAYLEDPMNLSFDEEALFMCILLILVCLFLPGFIVTFVNLFNLVSWLVSPTGQMVHIILSEVN